MSKQLTLANKISCSGVGLHSGQPVAMTLYPAPANSGIVFKRLDLGKNVRIPARYDAVSETRLGTTIRNKQGATVATIEHLMAALWGAGIDNAVVELDGPEVPIMDGSSEPFLFMVECAGVVRQAAGRKVLRALKTVEVREGNSLARLSPNREGEEGCVLDIEIEYEGTIIPRQRARYDFREMTFKQTLSRARTFGFEHEVEALREIGLARGGSLENAVVVGKDAVLNEEGLRYGDEFIRHKALDCLGDFSLAGFRIDGQFTCVRPGHSINNLLLRALMADETAYVLAGEESVLPVAAPVAVHSRLAVA